MEAVSWRATRWFLKGYGVEDPVHRECQLGFYSCKVNRLVEGGGASIFVR